MNRNHHISRRGFLQGCAFAAAVAIASDMDISLGEVHASGLEIRTSRYAICDKDRAILPVTLYNGSGERITGELRLVCEGGNVSPERTAIDLPPGGWRFVIANVTMTPDSPQAKLICGMADAKTFIVVRRGIDLANIVWKQKFISATEPIDPHWASPDLDDTSWPDLRIPKMWESNDNAWCRAHLAIPEDWKGQPLHVYLQAVDDNDITYWNGVEIGHTDGWDTVRDYVVPPALIRYGETNVLTVMVENPTYGGGMYRSHYLLYTGSPGWMEENRKSLTQAYHRPKPGPIGSPLPLRPIHVKEGVLRYPDGKEVALWGTNYYPMSWWQFVNMEKTGVDMKATIRRDLDDMKEMGVQAIRIHVFDREISDGDGNLQDNIHLDLLQYLVAQCEKRDIYFYFTLIAWWGSPNALPDSFSNVTSKPGMMFVPKAKKAAANFIRQFLNHRNPYNQKPLKADPPVVFLEVMNEPAYFEYNDITGDAYHPQGETKEVLERDHRIFRGLWRDWLQKYGLKDDPAYFPLFRYALMREYISEMIGAIRSVGAKQPIAISFFSSPGEDITQAIADSECDAITVSAYPGGWAQINDGRDLLPEVGPLELDPMLARKARVAYEFDAPATNTSCYLYPALAAHFRSGECQIACQFQYDTIATARWNTDWNAHWLNLLYTPTKAVSYMVGREAFHLLPRGIKYKAGTDHLTLPPMAVSFKYNLSLLMTSEEALYSRSIHPQWHPLTLPKNPIRVVGTGSSPYVDYDGSGMYILQKISPNVYQLIIHPDSILVGSCLTSSFEKPVANLESRERRFEWKSPLAAGAKCFRMNAGKRVPAKRSGDGWIVSPGEYRIMIERPPKG
jgi:hypothetical protein